MRKKYLTHLPGCLMEAIVLNFGLRGHIADIITYTKCCDNRFRGFGVPIPSIIWHHRNSWSGLVAFKTVYALPCYSVIVDV